MFFSYSDGDYYIFSKNVEEMLLNSSDLTFKLEIIGLGIAKNIKYEWSENSIKQFNEYFELYKSSKK